MTIQQESDTYDRAVVDKETGEIQEFDSVLFNNVVRKEEIEFVKSNLGNMRGVRVLDFGCGGGWLTRMLVVMGLNAVGVDVSRGILKTAGEADLLKGRLVRADGHHLPFRREAFDAVVCVGALHHTDLERLLPGLARVTKPDGSLVFMEPNKLNPFSEIGRRLFPMDTHTPGERPYSPDQLKRELTERGWEVQESHTIFLYALALSYIIHKTAAHRLATKLTSLVDRHERHLTKLLSVLPIGAVILGTAKLRKTAPGCSEC